MAAHMVNGKPISANELAKRVGTVQSNITRMLHGTQSRPSIVQRVATYFKVPLSYMYDGESEEKKEGERQSTTSYLIHVEPDEMPTISNLREAPKEIRDMIATVLDAAMKAWRERGPNPRK
jgi:transcriptional regulator with XRE-family HTH domain